MQKNYQSINPYQFKKIQKSNLTTKRSRALSLVSIEPLSGCQGWEELRQNKIKISYRLKRIKLADMQKENRALAERIINQKSSYLGKMTLDKGSSSVWRQENKQGSRIGIGQSSRTGILQINRTGIENTHHRRNISFRCHPSNKQNMQQIDKILKLRDKQIKKLACGKNILK